MEDKKTYLQKMADQLTQWDSEIDALKAKVDKTKAEAKTELVNQINELDAKREAAQNKLKQLHNAGDSAWDEIKAGVERSWTEVKSAVANASAKFKQNK